MSLLQKSIYIISYIIVLNQFFFLQSVILSNMILLFFKESINFSLQLSPLKNY